MYVFLLLALFYLLISSLQINILSQASGERLPASESVS